MIYFLAIICSSLLALCFAFVQELTIYTGSNYTGDSLNLKSKVADLVGFSPGIVLQAQSDCLIGHWIFYQDANFLTDRSPVNVNLQLRCYNDSPIPYVASARFLGPEDTDTDSISFYSQESYFGDEMVIEDDTSIIPFTPSPGSLFSTGSSSWILFSGVNYTGDAVCFTPTYSFHYMSPINDTRVRSVLKNCNRRHSRVDRYLTPEL